MLHTPLPLATIYLLRPHIILVVASCVQYIPLWNHISVLSVYAFELPGTGIGPIASTHSQKIERNGGKPGGHELVVGNDDDGREQDDGMGPG